MKSPLAKAIFRIDGVSAVFFGPDFVTVTKSSDDLSWGEMKPEVRVCACARACSCACAYAYTCACVCACACARGCALARVRACERAFL